MKPAVNSRKISVLRRRKDFADLQQMGLRVSPSPWIILNYRKNNRGQIRCAWTIPTRVGSAVIRNRLKRWCREFFRSLSERDFAVEIDINVVIRAKNEEFFKRLEHSEFRTCLEKGWKRITRDL